MFETINWFRIVEKLYLMCSSILCIRNQMIQNFTQMKQHCKALELKTISKQITFYFAKRKLFLAKHRHYFTPNWIIRYYLYGFIHIFFSRECIDRLSISFCCRGNFLTSSLSTNDWRHKFLHINLRVFVYTLALHTYVNQFLYISTSISSVGDIFLLRMTATTNIRVCEVSSLCACALCH